MTETELYRKIHTGDILDREKQIRVWDRDKDREIDLDKDRQRVKK